MRGLNSKDSDFSCFSGVSKGFFCGFFGFFPIRKDFFDIKGWNHCFFGLDGLVL
jgi:hypothetical protein